MQLPVFQPDRQRLAALRAADRQRHPHTVPQRGLMRFELGEDEFHRRSNKRRLWIAKNCRSSFFIDDLLDASSQPIGKLYRFEDADEALWFRMRF